MASKKVITKDQESLADALFPAEEEDFEEAILSIPPEKRILRTDQYDFSVSTLVHMMKNMEVTIPEFQRRYVWSERQASRLIESLIIQCPIPVVYLNQEKDETFSVIDGNQRLRSLKSFIGDEFTLTGLTSYPELTGLRYSQLDKRFKRHIGNRVLRCTVILKETHPQVKFDVFERLNSGAVSLTRQEIRHGLFYGKLLKNAATIASELKLTKHFGSRKDKRMKAEELVLRYWALSVGVGTYEKPLATFISNYAEENRNPSDEEMNVLLEDIRQTHSRAIDLFGDYCFTYSRDEKKSRFNAAVYDAQMAACSNLSKKNFKALSMKPKTVQKSYKKLQLEPDYSKSITLATSDKAALQGRIHSVSKMLKTLI